MSTPETPDPQAALSRRILGIETEYGITTSDGGQRTLGPEQTARYMFKPVVARRQSSNAFLANGSRLYLDVGAHPEYATAECDSLSQLIAHERAGDRIMDALARAAEEAMAAEGVKGQVYLFKNNVDALGNSFGCHENLLIARSTTLKTLGERLLPFLITRQLTSGAGLIGRKGFVLSQRADQLWEGVSSATTRTRPIINTRDEPHADSSRYRRMHVISGDSSMAQPTLALKVGSLVLLVEMLEAGFPVPEFPVVAPVRHIREVAADLTGRAALPLEGGGEVTALEIQQALADAAEQWLEYRVDAGTPTEELARVVELWQRVLGALDSGNLEAVERDIDWVAKYRLLSRYRERLGCEWTHPRLRQIDLAYHDIRPGRGLFSALEGRGLLNRWIGEDAIEAARENPPETTRAAARGRFVAEAERLGANAAVDWTHLKVNRPEPHVLDLLDPFEPEPKGFDRIVRRLPAAASTPR